MNQIATTNDKGTKPVSKPLAPGGALAAFVPQDSTQLLMLAERLAQSGDMIPKSFQNNPPAIVAAIMRGMEIGLAPIQSLSSIAVINGRASLWGDALPALMHRAGHHIDVELEGTGDALTAVATLTRGDTGKKIVRTFSMADAKRANLLGKPGPWQQYPQRMISHRARAWAIRDGAADALMGLQAAEETSDYGPDAARDVTPTTPRRGGAIYRDPDPVVDDVVMDAVEPDRSEPDTPEDAAAMALAKARAAAAMGTASFRAWYNSEDGKACRAATTMPVDELKAICVKADAAREDDPFGLPPVDGPSAADLARAEQDARMAAEMAAQE